MNAHTKPTPVLIVDDHPIFRDGVRRSLFDADDFMVIGEARDGESAVALTARLQPGLILLDLNLPDISGLEVLRRLKDANTDARVLILTANIDRTQTNEALRLGARGVVLKDSGAEVLLKCMRAIMAGEYWVGRELLADFVDYLKRQTPGSTVTARERQIVESILAGMSNREIGDKLGISEETVKRHIRNIYDKLGVSNRMELALYVSAGKLRL